MSSGMAALHLAYLELKIGVGDEVIVPALTHTATAHAVEAVGATPVFVDCAPETGNIDVSKLRSLIGPKTKAFINSQVTSSVTSVASARAAYALGTATLRNGSKGEAVRELQRFLNDKLNLGLTQDGRLGPKTIAVIKKWQKDNGLVADGLVGPMTKAQMNASVQ